MLANTVYSGAPAHLFGLEQVIEIGPMSGKSNVAYWLERHNVPVSDEIVSRILDAAKKSSRVLSDDELLALAGAQSRRA
jgi:hypothetical protein